MNNEREEKFGVCHLCGANGKLSFEHTPPEAAFNNNRVLVTTFEGILASKNLEDFSGKYQQRGMGAYTLCRKCNSNTGGWYGDAFAKWALQAMEVVLKSRGNVPPLHLRYNLFPLRVLKQIVCMFFSINGEDFQANQPALVKFVIDPKSKNFSQHVKIYVFYTLSNKFRAFGSTGIIKGLGTSKSRVHIFSEITFPPFGFIMTLGDSTPPEDKFCEISGFSQFSYNDWRVGISMKIPFMPTFTPFPGDYRTQEQTMSDYNK